MPQIFDVIANENARYKRNELELAVSEKSKMSQRIRGRGGHHIFLIGTKTQTW